MPVIASRPTHRKGFFMTLPPRLEEELLEALKAIRHAANAVMHAAEAVEAHYRPRRDQMDGR